MRSQLFQATVLSGFFFLTACSAPEKEGATAVRPVDSTAAASNTASEFMTDCKVLRQEAFRMDSILLGQTEVNPASANQAIKAFTSLARYCPGDTVSPVYLVKTAQVALAIGNVSQAKTSLDQCLSDYPNFKDRPAALFLLAQLYDETAYLNNEQEAKVLYQKIIDEHPKSAWAASAKGAMRFIGKSDAEIIEELKKKNK